MSGTSPNALTTVNRVFGPAPAYSPLAGSASGEASPSLRQGGAKSLAPQPQTVNVTNYYSFGSGPNPLRLSSFVGKTAPATGAKAPPPTIGRGFGVPGFFTSFATGSAERSEAAARARLARATGDPGEESGADDFGGLGKWLVFGGVAIVAFLLLRK